MTMFAFQGGGAKLVDLLAVGKAIHDLDFPYSSVAGTSAGSIVAAVLAARKDPALLRDHFIREEKTIRKRLPKKSKGTLAALAGLRQLYSVGMKGGTFVRSGVLPILVEEGLSSIGLTKNTKISDLKPVTLKVVAADLRAKEPKIYKDDASLIDSVVRSCSLPLIFSSYVGNEPHIVDGGLFANLPVDVLLDEFGANNEIIAVAFATDYEFAPKSTFDYLGSMVSSMIDARTQDSALRVGDDNVMKITTKIGSFSPDDFFDHLKGKYFDDRVAEATEWLKSWRSRQNAQFSDYRSSHVHPPIYSRYLSEKLQLVAKLLQQPVACTIESLDVRVDTSINEDDDGYDSVTTTIVLEPDPNNSQVCYTCHTVTESGAVRFISAEWSVVDCEGNNVPHVAVPIHLPDKGTTKIMIFFGKPLGGLGGYDKCYTIVQRQILHNLMAKLLLGKTDYFRVSATESALVRKVTLKMSTKRGFGKVRQWKSNDDIPGTEGKRAHEASRDVLCWDATDLKAGQMVDISYRKEGQ